MNSFIYVRVSYLATLEWSWFLPGSSEPSGSKAATNNHLSLWLAVELWQLHGSTSGAPALNQLVTLVRRPGWCRTTTFFMEQLGTLSTCGNCYVIVKRYWAFRGLYFSESVVFHLDSWVSFSVVFCLGCVWGGFVALEDTWLFAFHLFSYNVRIADRPQDVLMTVRASSVHGMS